MFPIDFFAPLIKGKSRKVPAEKKKVIILASYLDAGISYVQVAVGSKGSKEMDIMGVVSDSHQNALLKAIENTGDPEVKAYLRTALCDVLD